MAGNDDKPRLTEEEKKQNHIASGKFFFSLSSLGCHFLTYSPEQKRRQAIREGFDRLTEIVPGLQGQARSEGLVLKGTVDYMREQLSERQKLIARIEQQGGEVDPQLKK